MDITLTSLEKEHSELLKAKIASEITSQGGWIPFSRYMEMALYEPGMGYYSAGAHKLGSGGDFTTAPELSPLFGAAICSTLIPVLDGLRANGLPTQILEFGAGTGKLATSILTRLQDLGFVLDRYDIIEISPDLAQRQQERMTKTIEQIHSPTQCEWLSELPKNYKGIILANEVIDAIPCDMVIYQNGFWYWYGVAIENSQLIWRVGSPVDQKLLPKALLDGNFSEGYITELHAPANAWMHHVAKQLHTGLFLSFDYGFPENEYYHPQRLQGTLMAHHRHHVGDLAHLAQDARRVHPLRVTVDAAQFLQHPLVAGIFLRLRGRAVGDVEDARLAGELLVDEVGDAVGHQAQVGRGHRIALAAQVLALDHVPQPKAHIDRKSVV